jgi:multiple sugar transport system permease protein
MERGRKRRDFTPLFFLSPSLTLFSVFIVYPFIRATWYSINEVSLLGGMQGFTGIHNYLNVFKDTEFPLVVKNSLLWTFCAVSLQLIFGGMVALLLNQKFRLRGMIRGLAMIPWATPSVLVALMWMWLLDPNHGIINATLLNIGIIDHPIALLSTPNTALWTLILVDVWQGIPFFAVMILAAIQSVPEELRDAAKTDGCSRAQVFRNVVIPHIFPTVLITLVLRIIWTANYIDLIYILTGGGPGYSSTTLALQSYRTAYKIGDMGQGAAMIMLQASILAFFIAYYVHLSNKKEG